MHETSFAPVKILAFYDNKRGAWWNCFHNMQKKFSPDIQFDYIGIYTDFNPNSYDFFMVLEEYLLPFIAFLPAEKIISGCNCPLLFEPAHRAHKEGRYRAAIYNCEEMYQKAQDMMPLVFYGPSGVDTELFSPAVLLPKKLTACWVGNSKSIGQKGLDLIKQACAEAAVPLRYLDSAEQQRPMTHEEIRDEYYRKSSVYICASATEGTPNPALEALACGLPVITTRVGNMPELIVEGHNGMFVERSVASITEALNTMKTADIALLSKNARESVVNGWTWKEQTKRYEDAFKAIAASTNSVSVQRISSNSYRTFLLQTALQSFLRGDVSTAWQSFSWAVKYTALWRGLRDLKNKLAALQQAYLLPRK